MALLIKIILIIILLAIALLFVVFIALSIYYGIDYVLSKIVKVKTKEQALNLVLKLFIIVGLIFATLYYKLYLEEYFSYVLTPIAFVLYFLVYYSISYLYSLILSAIEYNWIKKNLRIIAEIDQVNIGVHIDKDYKSSGAVIIVTDKGICIFPCIGFLNLRHRSFFLKGKSKPIERPAFIKVENYVDIIKMGIDEKHQRYFNIYCENRESQLYSIRFSIEDLEKTFHGVLRYVI